MKKIALVKDLTVKWIADHWAVEGAHDKNLPHFAFLSIPFDYAVSYRPGTRFGPESILEALNNYTLYCADKRISLHDTVFLNMDPVEVVHSFDETYSNIENAVAHISEQHIPILLGGDHSITDPIIRGMKRKLKGKDFGLIIFDNHFDFRTPIPGKEHSGNWLKTLEDVLDYRKVAILGMGAPIYSLSYMKELENLGVLIKTPYDIRKMSWSSIREEVVNHIMKKTRDGVYFSIDIDSLDQAFAPATSVPNPNGIFPYEIMDTIFEIASALPAVGMDITEVSPPLDINKNFTSHIAAQVIINFVAGVVKRMGL
jgi:agmatinase